MMLILLIHEHGMCFHLFVSSSISFFSVLKFSKYSFFLFPWLNFMNPKWIKDLNISYDIIKILEKNIGSKISDISCSNIFAGIYTKARKIQGKNKQMGLHQIRRFPDN